MSLDSPRQLSLSVGLNDAENFDNFLAVSNKAKQVKEFLNHWSLAGSNNEPFVYLGGNAGVGKTHMLQACCHRLGSTGQTAQYLPLAELKQYNPVELFAGLEQLPLICLDDLQSVAGDPQWEQALFAFYNHVRDMGNKLLVSGNAAPAALGFGLADLASRLSSGPVFVLDDLEDDQKIAILSFRAKCRGFVLSQEVAQFLINRSSRSMASLIEKLDALDKHTLEQQRLLTIPFVKQLFSL